jgi:hypothetical protein
MTRLRASLEDARQALWLLAPTSRDERLTRALRVWHRGLSDRAEHERHAPHKAGKKTGLDRQKDMRAIRKRLNLDVGAVGGALWTTSIIAQACELLGQEG